MSNWQMNDAESAALLWILSKADSFGLKFNLNSSMFDACGEYLYSCHIVALGANAKGFASDSNKRRAQLKSAMEALERWLVELNGWPHSSGVSLHPDPEIACEKATLEALERDAFFCHFYTQTAFCTLELDWGNSLTKLGATGELRRVRTHSEIFTVLAILKNPQKNIGVCLGLGTSRSLTEAVAHAQREAMSFYLYLASDLAPENYSLEKFNTVVKSNALENGHLGKNTEYSDWFWKTYLANSTIFEPQTISVPRAQSFPLPSELSDAPIYLYRADHSGLQEPFWGRSDGKNGVRLSSFAGRATIDKDYPPYPHCFA